MSKKGGRINEIRDLDLRDFVKMTPHVVQERLKAEIKICPGGGYCGMVTEIEHKKLVVTMVGTRNPPSIPCACRISETLEQHIHEGTIVTTKLTFYKEHLAYLMRHREKYRPLQKTT